MPYYIVLDDQSDVTLTPELAAQQGGQLTADYRRDFNSGVVHLTGGVGTDEDHIQAYVFSSASFNWDDTWRYGANVNLGTSVNYLRDYQIEGYLANFLASSVNIEGFGVGSYTKLDGLVWQGLNSSTPQSTLPYVLPRYTYSYFGEPDALGGRLSFDTQAFDVLRSIGTSDQRVAMRLGWERPFSGRLGEQYLFSVQAAGTAYNATVLNGQPNFGLQANSQHRARAAAGFAADAVAVRARRRQPRDAAAGADRATDRGPRNRAIHCMTGCPTKTAWITSSPTRRCSA